MDTKIYKEKLEKEFKLLEKEMSEVGRRNPSNPNDWEPVETEMDSDHTEDGDIAENIESFEDNRAILGKLESQYNDVKDALEKIKQGTYGKCEVGGENIPEDRLMANPAAKTCIKHATK